MRLHHRHIDGVALRTCIRRIKKSEKHIAESIKKDLGDLDELPDTAIVFFILKLRLEVSRGFISIMLREA